MSNDPKKPIMTYNESEVVNRVRPNEVSKNLGLEIKKEFFSDEDINRPRPERKEFSIATLQLKLSYPQKKGFRREWVIDSQYSIYEARGWRPVQGEDGDIMRNVMSPNAEKGPMYGTYMEIPETWYNENLAEDDIIRKEQLAIQLENAAGNATVLPQFKNK